MKTRERIKQLEDRVRQLEATLSSIQRTIMPLTPIGPGHVEPWNNGKEDNLPSLDFEVTCEHSGELKEAIAELLNKNPSAKTMVAP